jgi:hypothetical protein
MSGIRAAIKSSDNVIVASDQINEFSFAFVSPLEPN